MKENTLKNISVYPNYFLFMFCIVLVNVCASSLVYKQFNHLAKPFGVISVLTKANRAPAFKLIFIYGR